MVGGMKRCTICGEVKPLDDFYRMTGMRDGHRSDCKSCNLAAKKASYDATGDGRRAVSREWQRRRTPSGSRRTRREYRQPARAQAGDARPATTGGRSGSRRTTVDAHARGAGRRVRHLSARGPSGEASLHVDH